MKPVQGRSRQTRAPEAVMEIRIDVEANAAYVQLARGEVAETREQRGLTVDVDAAGRVLGVEMLGLGASMRNGGWGSDRGMRMTWVQLAARRARRERGELRTRADLRWWLNRLVS